MNELKCPKCGGVLYHDSLIELNNETYTNEWCPKLNCDYFKRYNNRTYEDVEYQARLDKVLSKMKAYKKVHNHKFLYVGYSKISIEYNNGKFYLEDTDERQTQISLDTVECLLRDLEQ